MSDSPELDDAAFEAELAAKARRGRLLSVAIAVVVVLVAVLVFVITRPELPPLDAAKVDDVRKALPQMKQYPEARRGFAGKALQELEGDRLPAPILSALGDMGAVPPGMEGMICTKAVAEPEVLEMFTDACPGGADILASAVQSGHRVSLVAECGVEGQPFSSEDAIAGPVGCVALGIAVWGYLRSKNAEEEIERTLLRMLVTGQ